MKKQSDPYTQLDGEAMGGSWVFTQGQLTALKSLIGGLAAFMAYMIVYTCWTDGSPFRKELLIPWMVATLVDFYTNQLVLYLWVFYKEDTAVMRVGMLVLMICLGSLTTCCYVLWHLFKLAPGQGPKDILLNPSDSKSK